MDIDVINNVSISYPEEDGTFKVEDSIKAIGVKIEAARSGKVNGNLCFYTPKAMKQGVETFLKPFPKHIQSKHNGEALGPITEAEYTKEFFPEASYHFLDLVKKIHKYSEESNGKELTKAVKELIKTPEYRDESYRGLGIANIYGDIHDPQAIYEIKTRDKNKGTVSIGGKSSEVFCSICGEQTSRTHEHKKGTFYNDELCFHIHNDLQLDHCGFVTVPADKLTNTEIVKDEEDSNLTVNITHFKTEKCMTLEQLKEAIKDASAVKTLISEKITDEALQAKALESYEASLKNSRSNHFLLNNDKLLNLRSIVGISIAEDLIEKMDDQDENKEYLKETIKKAKAVLEIENTKEALDQFLNGAKNTETPSEEKEETPKEDDTKVEDSKTETLNVQDMLNKITDLITTKFDELKEQSFKVQDNQQNTILANELNSLREALDADEKTIQTLQENHKETLIKLIEAKKGDTLSEAYLEKLKTRSVEELKLTLEDLEESLRSTKEEKVAEPSLEPVSQEEAIQKVEDEQKEIVTPSETETPEEKEEVKVEDEKQLTPEEWLSQRIKEVGLAKASKEFKVKFKK